MIFEVMSATNFGMYLYNHVKKNKATLRQAHTDKKSRKKKKVLKMSAYILL